MLELDASAAPDDVALRERLRAGAHTRLDVLRVCERIEALVERWLVKRAH